MLAYTHACCVCGYVCACVCAVQFEPEQVFPAFLQPAEAMWLDSESEPWLSIVTGTDVDSVSKQVRAHTWFEHTHKSEPWLRIATATDTDALSAQVGSHVPGVCALAGRSRALGGLLRCLFPPFYLEPHVCLSVCPRVLPVSRACMRGRHI